MDEQLHPNNSPRPRRDRRLIAPAAFVAALLGGGIAGSVLGGPSVSAALQGDETTTTAADTGETTATETGSEEEATSERGDCGPGGRALGPFADLAVIAETLGVTEDDLWESLRDGSSIADVAEVQGVDVQTVIDALVAAATTALDERVAAGELDEERAAEIESRLVERITAKVNGEGGFGPGGHGLGGPRGARPGAPEDGAPDTTTADPEGS